MTPAKCPTCLGWGFVSHQICPTCCGESFIDREKICMCGRPAVVDVTPTKAVCLSLICFAKATGKPIDAFVSADVTGNGDWSNYGC